MGDLRWLYRSCEWDGSGMCSINAERWLPMQHVCRRHTRPFFHAGLIRVSVVQTAPWTLKLSLRYLCMCWPSIMPSVLRAATLWWFDKWGEEGCFAGCDLLMRVISRANELLPSYIPEERESQVFKWRQINDILANSIFPSSMRRTSNVSGSWKKVKFTHWNTTGRHICVCVCF